MSEINSLATLIGYCVLIPVALLATLSGSMIVWQWLMGQIYLAGERIYQRKLERQRTKDTPQ